MWNLSSFWYLPSFVPKDIEQRLVFEEPQAPHVLKLATHCAMQITLLGRCQGAHIVMGALAKSTLRSVREMQGMRTGMSLVSHVLWFPVQEFLGSFPDFTEHQKVNLGMFAQGPSFASRKTNSHEEGLLELRGRAPRVKEVGIPAKPWFGDSQVVSVTGQVGGIIGGEHMDFNS